MRITALLAATTIAAGFFTAPASAETTVTFWQFSTRDADIAAWNGAIASFEKANPDIKINMEIVPWSEQQQRLVSALSAGGLPDVSMLGNNVVAQFQSAGALAPLDEYFAAYDKEHGTDVAADVWPGDKGYYNLAGKWWASPVNVETRALYYRKDLFKDAGLDPEKPPQTWADFAADATKLTRDGTYGAALSMSLDYFTVQNFMSAYLGYGARMIGEDGKCGFDTPEFKSALDTYVSVYKNKATHPDAPSMSGDTFRKGFRDGKFAMILSDAGLYKDLQNDKAPFLDQVGIAMVPAGPKNRSGFLGGWPLVLWDASENKEAAAKWILYATHGDALKTLATEGGFIPGSVSLAKGEPWTNFPYPLFVEQLQDARAYQYPSEAIPQMGQLEVDTIQKAVQAVALGQQTTDEATAQLCTTINEVLAR
ncbi:sugar ABC transporter substrate-binding protein [Kaistia defluvii]|uniref:ABC transporter substrate-binding protein n=1 Tax=Kaistia defluvii TaxID=410841 RepID=UPI002259DA32|nr:sugar ABC transporter substrate-binding protein [Kaistia defluvii]MCX5518823.1 sugar ABC transporter substrate-binding protein [Kaistia defluvii]